MLISESVAPYSACNEDITQKIRYIGYFSFLSKGLVNDIRSITTGSLLDLTGVVFREKTSKVY